MKTRVMAVASVLAALASPAVPAGAAGTGAEKPFTLNGQTIVVDSKTYREMILRQRIWALEDDKRRHGTVVKTAVVDAARLKEPINGMPAEKFAETLPGLSVEALRKVVLEASPTVAAVLRPALMAKINIDSSEEDLKVLRAELDAARAAR